MSTILIVDDEPHILDVVRFALEKAGFDTVLARNGAEALAQFAERRPDMVILDIMLPDIEGTEICRRLRQQSTVPILFLTSCDDEIDRIVGLEIGGDDYVGKPFSPRELVARVKAILRRGQDSSPVSAGTGLLHHGQLTVDPNRFKACWQQRELTLTVTEFNMLHTLIEQPGRVFSRDGLMDRVYGVGRVVSDRTIDSHIRRLRAKLTEAGASEVIETVHGLGYRLGGCD